MSLCIAVPGVRRQDAFLAASPVARADQARPSFDDFMTGLREEARSRGISQQTVDSALTGLLPDPVVVTRDRTQPEQIQSLDAYLSQRLSRRTIDTAREMSARHRGLLANVETSYGVPRAVMVAIWGLESNFGRFTGTYPTIRSLVTLAYDNRRPLFRAELFAALAMIDSGRVDAANMKGSWAGAMGQPQFMPSSFLAHAVDFDADGRIDIWTSAPDVFASMANYLRNSGWRNGERWGREVAISADALDSVDRQVPMRVTGCRARRTMTESRSLAEWTGLGATLPDGQALPTADVQASLVRGRSRHFLTYRNYEAILDYNCSHSYAVAAGLLSDVVP